MKLQEAVKKETGITALGTGIAVILMYIIFFILNKIFPNWAPFDLAVILGGICGFVVAVGNFFWMAVTVQKVAAIEDEERARKTMGVSYRYRTLMQLVWVILAIVVPVFNMVSGIVPLFIPSIIIKLRGIISAGKGG